MSAAIRCVDLQVNGYAGIDFNSDSLSTDEMLRACEALRNDGVAKFLPTVITASVEQMQRRLGNIVATCQQESLIRDMVAGIHIEGPFLNPGDGTVGAHPREHVQPASVDVMQELLDACDGLVRIVTLAPECDPGLAVTKMLSGQGIVVSAGHCDPSIDQLKAAVDSGLSMFTHVGNGCSLMQDRHDNIVQRVLSLADHIWCCFIADGIHVPPFALKNYLQVAGIDRSIVVTDAMTAAGLGPGEYKLGSQTVHVDDQFRAMLPGSDGRLAGSVSTMPWLERVLAEDVGLTSAEIEELTVRNPMKALEAAG